MTRVADYVLSNYDGRVVEVGVGKNHGTAEELRKTPNIDVTTVDVDGSADPDVVDDILKPEIEIYRGASLVYSIRPPPELHSALHEVADAVDADLLIVPLGNEPTPIEHRLVNHEGRTVYLSETDRDR
ncbi:MAG: UPF0146 family protein [Halobacteria archaeon]